MVSAAASAIMSHVNNAMARNGYSKGTDCTITDGKYVIVRTTDTTNNDMGYRLDVYAHGVVVHQDAFCVYGVKDLIFADEATAYSIIAALKAV